MEISTVSPRDLHEFLTVLDPDLEIDASLRALRSEMTLLVPSFLGLSVTVVVEDQPVVLTSMVTGFSDATVGSSLDLPLSLAGGFAAGSALVFYALASGAFVNLAAELEHALPSGDGELVLDRHLGPLRSGIAGVEQLAIINRAVGLLAGRGQTPDDARKLLQRKAVQCNLGVFQVAAFLVSTTE